MNMENDLNMRPAPKKNDGTGLLEGALGAAVGTAAGAAVGVGGAYAYERLTENDGQEEPVMAAIDSDDDVQIAQAEPQQVHHHEVHHIHHTTDVYVVDAPAENVSPVVPDDIYPVLPPDEPFDINEPGPVVDIEDEVLPDDIMSPDELDPTAGYANDPGTDGGDPLYTSLEGDGTMPDYVNNGDVGDMLLV